MFFELILQLLLLLLKGAATTPQAEDKSAKRKDQNTLNDINRECMVNHWQGFIIVQGQPLKQLQFRLFLITQKAVEIDQYQQLPVPAGDTLNIATAFLVADIGCRFYF